MDGRRVGALVRAARARKGLKQEDLARLAGVSRATVSRLESGKAEMLTVRTLDRIARAADVQAELSGHWHGGEGDRLLNWRHSLLADQVSAVIAGHGWQVEPEVSFSIYGERGVVDQLCWYPARAHLLIVEVKTEFVDFNEMLGTLDRKTRLAPKIARTRGWAPKMLSVWLVVSDSRTNRRHAASHASLLRARFPSDGRSFESFLRQPVAPSRGMAFLSNVHGENTCLAL